MRSASVVEAWRDVDREGHLAADAAHDPHQPVYVGRGRLCVHRHEVHDLTDAGLGKEAGHEHRGARDVELFARELLGRGSDAEVPAALTVEQRGENTGGVEAWEAEP